MLSWLPTILALALGYIALTGNLEPLNLVTAVVVALVVSLLLPKVPEADRSSSSWQRWPARFGAFAVYLPLVAWDVLLSGVAVARLVLRPSLPVRPGLVETPTPSGPEWMKAANAHAITLTPGELVMDMTPDRMRVHCLDAPRSAESMPEAQRWRRRWLARVADQQDTGELP
jgi:multicomponent Na+:H+ antiporter subunit E